jgi:platelet-activating factor acetylhydrolase
VLNSETFTLWGNHYERLQDVIRGWEPHGQRIITLGQYFLLSFQTLEFISPVPSVGSEHTSFSDALTLPLLSRKGARKLMDVISKLSIAFLDGNLEQALESIPRRKMEAEIVGKKKNKYGRPKKRLVGSIGEIIVM